MPYQGGGVLIAHEREFMARYITNVLDESDFRVVGTLTNFEKIQNLTVEKAPSICLVGSSSSKLSALCANLRVRFPFTRLILVDGGETEEAGVQARELGLDGCLSLDLSPALLLSGMRLIEAGTQCFPEVDEAEDQVRVAGSEEPAERPVTLTPREKSVLALIGKGMSNKLIARELDIAESTVKAHLNAVLRKTGTSNRTQAARWAFFNDSVGLSSHAS